MTPPFFFCLESVGHVLWDSDRKLRHQRTRQDTTGSLSLLLSEESSILSPRSGMIRLWITQPPCPRIFGRASVALFFYLSANCVPWRRVHALTRTDTRTRLCPSHACYAGRQPRPATRAPSGLISRIHGVEISCDKYCD